MCSVVYEAQVVENETEEADVGSDDEDEASSEVDEDETEDVLDDFTFPG